MVKYTHKTFGEITLDQSCCGYCFIVGEDPKIPKALREAVRKTYSYSDAIKVIEEYKDALPPKPTEVKVNTPFGEVKVRAGYIQYHTRNGHISSWTSGLNDADSTVDEREEHLSPLLREIRKKEYKNASPETLAEQVKKFFPFVAEKDLSGDWKIKGGHTASTPDRPEYIYGPVPNLRNYLVPALLPYADALGKARTVEQANKVLLATPELPDGAKLFDGGAYWWYAKGEKYSPLQNTSDPRDHARYAALCHKKPKTPEEAEAFIKKLNAVLG